MPVLPLSPLCDLPLDGPQLADASGGGMHAACLAGPVPEDALVALLGLLVVALAPAVVVWAG
jgi:hypothetical protein